MPNSLSFARFAGTFVALVFSRHFCYLLRLAKVPFLGCTGEAMGGYLNAVWGCRYFWLSLVGMDLRVRYRRSMLGIGWSLLHPIAMTIILSFVFAKLWKQEIRDFAPYLLTGLACWSYILNVALQGCQCLFTAESYIRQFPAPMAIYPIRTALGGTIHFLLAMVVVVGLSWWLQGFSNLGALVSLVPTLLLLFALVWSLAVLFGFLNVMFPDTQHLAEVGFQLLFYATPIMYPKKLLIDNQMEWLLRYNPVVTFLDLVREPILYGHFPGVETFGMATGFVLLLVCAATLTLACWQRRIIFYL